MKEFFKYTLATITGIIVAGIIGMLFLIMVIGAIVASTEKTVIVEDQSLLLVRLDHQIVDRTPNDPFSDLNIPGLGSSKKLGLDNILSSLKKAAVDERIRGIYLDLSVVNGGMAAVEEIRNGLAAFKDSCDKPIYAYGDMYDQRAYYLATIADKVVLNPQGAVDFRGLGGEYVYFKKAFEKLGVEMQIVRHGKFKAAGEQLVLEKMSDENREQTMGLLTSLWDHMLKGISEQRNIPVEKLNELADQVMTFRRGEEVLASGMVDALKYKDEVLDDLREITGIAPKKDIPVVGIANYARAPLKKDKKSQYSRNKIAVVYASGEIGMSLSGSEVISGDKLSREIRKIRQDSSYKAVVLRIDSPGGSAFDSEVIWREVHLTAAEKTVVVSMGNVAASGGYYIACAAARIVAQPNTITGSIGVISAIPNAGELLNDKLGITSDVVKTNKHSDMPSLTRKMTDFERDLMQQNVEDFYDVFLERVAQGRNMEKSVVDEMGQGRIWSGEKAVGLGLVDELGGLDRAIELAAEMAGLETYRTVALPALPDPFQELLQGGADNIKSRWLRQAFGESARYLEVMEKAGRMNGIYTRLPYDIDIR